MFKHFKKIGAALLALAAALSLCPAAFAAEEAGVIHIRTAEELMDLAVKCSLDTWSDGKKVVLDRDISLSEVSFDSIPIFNGEFDGKGHTIYDLVLNSAQSPCGFFLETGKNANIHDLNLSGSVSTRGDDNMVGGFVGLNRGQLTNCGFSGEVSATSQVGGIAGRNEATGILSSCKVSGSVRGLSQTGGIVGDNAGALSLCENLSFVNTESVDPSLRLDAIDTSSIPNFIRSLRTDNAGITTDTGGVAGNSTGFVEGCSNSGPVGYLHLGYNVGGIVGHSSGLVSGCSNSGEVYGRKDVGGVVGQAEPLIENIEAENLLAGVSYRLYALDQALNDAVRDARSVSDDIAACFDAMHWYLLTVSDAVRNIDVTDPETTWALQDAVTESLYGIKNEMGGLRAMLGQDSEALLRDVDTVNQNTTALTGAAIQAVDSISGGQQLEDILVDGSTDEAEEALVFGKIADSVNSADIYGDSNVGGIAGSLSVESDSDPESELNLGGSRLVRNTISLSAVITGCVNRGEVTAKRECAGGILGKTDFGLVSRCVSCGPVALEDGDYAGGICGLCYGSVKNCFVKCSLGGKRYLGGVVGNGCRADNGREKNSLVSGCYTLVEITGTPQFAGAVSGGGDGVYESNFFVPAGYAGLDRLSIHGQAEPISFEDFAAVEGLPEECRRFTLRFVVDGKVIRERGFDYGASFDRSVFPRVERKDGSYAVWDRGDLNDLRFDTTVTAQYRADEAVLRSEEARADGRAAVYVDGQFQKGDALELSLIPVAEGDIRDFAQTWRDTVREQLRSIFREGEPDYSIPVSIAERLRVSFPDDGLETHSLRYLPPNMQTANYRLYLSAEEGWQRIRPTVFGSYFLFEVPGDSAELALVSTIQSWWIAAYIAAALVILALLIVSVSKLRKRLRARPKKTRPPRSERPVPRWLHAHRKPLLIALPLLVLASAAGVLLLRVGSVGSAFTAWRAIKDYSGRETDVLTEISIQTDERDLEMSTAVHRVRQDGHMIRCTEQYGVPLYIADGTVYLENGRAFQLAEGRLSQGKALDLALDVFLHEEVNKTEEEGCVRYEALIAGETADRVWRLFLSGISEELLSAEDTSVTLLTADGNLQSLSFTGTGTTKSGAAFRFHVALSPRPMAERPVIPPAVLDAIANGGGEYSQVLSEDLLRLLAAWIKSESAEAVSADIDVSADCGLVTLNPRYRYSRQQVEGTDIHRVESALFTLYFTDARACTASGADLSEAQQRVADAAKLIPIARELCLRGQFACATTGERSVYSITLSSADAEDIVSQLLPELKRLSISYDDCCLRIAVVSGVIDSIELDCGGSLRVVSRDVDASVLITARFNGNTVRAVPARVREALLP